jgi:hypothetical protein
MTVMKHYPKWVYHFSASPKIVESQEEYESLDEGWCDHPSQVTPPPAPGEEEADDDALASATKPKSRKKK